MYSKLNWFIFFIVIVPSVLAGQSQLSFKRFSTQEGLSSERIRSIAEDEQGFLWVGTENGLHRYDGMRFHQFRFNPRNKNSISTNLISKLYVDRSNNLWICTNNGLTLLDQENGIFHRIKLGDKLNEQSALHIRDIVEDGQGIYWIATHNKGILKVNFNSNKDFKVDPILKNTFSPVGLSRENEINSVFEYGDYIWFIQNFEIGRIHKTKLDIELFNYTQINETNPTHIIHSFAVIDSTLHVVNAELSIYGLDLNHPHNPLDVGFSFQNSPNENLRHRDINLIKTKDNKLVIGIDDQLFKVDNNELKEIHFRSNKFSTLDKQIESEIRSLYQNSKGQLIVGTLSGLYRQSISKYEFNYYRSSDINPINSSNVQVRTIAKDQQGYYWIGFLRGGICRYEIDNFNQLKRVDHLTIGKTERRGLLSNDIIELLIDTKGKLWIGTNGQGLNKYDISNNTMSSFVSEESDSETIIGNRIWGLTEDKRGNIWVGDFLKGMSKIKTDNSVQRFKSKTNAPTTLSMNRVKTISQDHSGTIWIGTNSGLNKLNTETESITQYFHDPNNVNSLSSSFIYSIQQDINENMWIGTNLGLTKYNPKNETFQRFYEEDGLQSNSIYSLQSTNDTTMWIGTTRGIANININDHSIQQINLVEAIKNISAVPKSHFYDADKNLLFIGNREGLFLIDVSKIKQVDVNHKMLLSDFKIFNNAKNDESTSNRYFNYDKNKFVLTHLDRVAQFTFTDLFWNESFQYSYKLSGLSENWLPLDKNMNISLSNLRAGKYELYLKKEGGDIDSPIIQKMFQLFVKAPWWASRIALIMYAIIVSTIAYLFWSLDVKRRDSQRIIEVEKARVEVKQTQKEQIEKQAQQLKESLIQLKEKNEQIIQTQNKLIQREKLASLGQLTAGIAHEIKNPLNFVNNFSLGTLELLKEVFDIMYQNKDSLPTDDYKEMTQLLIDIENNAKDISLSGDRLDRIVHSMLDHVRDSKDELQETDINELLENNLNLSHHSFKALYQDFFINVSRNYDEILPKIPVYPIELGRAILNIINNALFEMKVVREIRGNNYSPTLHVSTSVISGKNQSSIRICIKDNGRGVPVELKNKIFEPFFSTKPSGEGNSGLGLSISYDIITKRHKGLIIVNTKKDYFTEFIIQIPFSENPSIPELT